MATADELRVVVRAEVDKATAEIKQFNSQLSKSGQQATKSAVNVAKLAAGVAAGVAAFRAGARVVRELTDAYAVQERAEAKLGAVLRATGEAAGFSQTQLETMAASLQTVTTFGDEAIINMQSLLLTFKGIQGEAFERTTELALDLSAAFDQDLKSSAMQLGKALEDPATGLAALREIGVSFTQEQQNMIASLQQAGDVAGAQAIILDTLEGQVGGVARAMADTGAGSAEQMANAIGDLKEGLGQLIDDALRPGREELLEFLGQMQEVDAYLESRGELSDAGIEAFMARDLAGMQAAADALGERMIETNERIADLQEQANEVGPLRRIGLNNQIIALEEELRSIEVERRNILNDMSNLTQAQVEAGQRLRAQEVARPEAAAEAERAAQRQAAADERYAQVRGEVLSILESEKTEIEKIREQIDHLNAHPWAAGGQLEADRLAAVAILTARLAELTRETDDGTRPAAERLASAMAHARDEMLAMANESRLGHLREQFEAAAAEAERIEEAIASTMSNLASDVLSGFGSALGGGEFDLSGMARSAVVGLTDAFAPGMGALAGGLFDIFEGAWSRMFGPLNENVQAATAEAAEFVVELEGVYRTEVEIRREYMDQLRRGFDEEFEVLRDQWNRNLISTDEFRAGMSGLNTGLEAAEKAAEEKAATEAAEDLEDARREKVEALEAERDRIQAEWDAMSWWQKLTTSADEEAKAQIDVLNSRIKTALEATTLRGIEAAANGADFMTNGPQLLLVGDNPGGREHVQVNPAPGRPMGMTININAPVFGVDDLYAKLEEAGQRMRRRGRVA